VPTTAVRSLLLLACLVTVLDCVKPLMIDDAAYYYYARQAADHPLDPYGFACFWWQRPYVANDVLAPPGLPYWWSAAVRLFGERPVLWKLWLLPFVLLFAGALYALFRRFCRGLELPLTWFTLLSPAFLPGVNLMLDIPALALSLAAVALFLRAADRDSPVLAALAGLVAGLGMETKYIGFLAPAVMLLYAVLYGKWRLWPAAAVVAAQVFVSWEFLIALLYGQSHFLLAARESSRPLLEKFNLVVPLLGILGTVAPPLALLGLAALRTPRWAVGLAGGLTLGGYAAVAVFGIGWHLEWQQSALPRLFPPGAASDLTLDILIFGEMGLLAVGVVAIAVVALCRLPSFHLPWTLLWRRYRARLFLLLWLGLELAGYFAMTPFPAVRRVMGVLIVATLLVGMLAARSCRSREGRRLVVAVVGFSAALGLGFAALDWWEAWTEKAMAEAAAATARAQGGGTVWFVGHWGFQFYGEHSGMRPIIPAYGAEQGEYDYVPLPEASQLRAGDWVVVPDGRVTQQHVALDPSCTEPAFTLAMRDPVPLQTVMCYYCGQTGLEHRTEDTRLTVTVYRVTADFTAAPP
jgi:hypothetical protein